MKAVSFVEFKKEIALFFVSECFIDTVSMKVIKVTLVIHKVNMFSEKYPVEIKFNFVSRRQKCHKGRNNCRLE